MEKTSASSSSSSSSVRVLKNCAVVCGLTYLASLGYVDDDAAYCLGKLSDDDEEGRKKKDHVDFDGSRVTYYLVAMFSSIAYTYLVSK